MLRISPRFLLPQSSHGVGRWRCPAYQALCQWRDWRTEESTGVFLVLPNQTSSSISCFCFHVLQKCPGSRLLPGVVLQTSLVLRASDSLWLTHTGFASEPPGCCLYPKGVRWRGKCPKALLHTRAWRLISWPFLLVLKGEQGKHRIVFAERERGKYWKGHRRRRPCQWTLRASQCCHRWSWLQVCLPGCVCVRVCVKIASKRWCNRCVFRISVLTQMTLRALAIFM